MMMKKVNYLLIMLFAVALMSTSCCKEDPIVPDEELTLETLDGLWVSRDYLYNSQSYGCNGLTFQTEYTHISLAITYPNWTIDSDCSTENTLGDMMVYDENTQKLSFYDHGFDNPIFKFDVLSYVDDGSIQTLTLKLTFENISLVDGDFNDIPTPINGIYTLQK